jgi:tetratricopeptide (TPR) repeat protein
MSNEATARRLPELDFAIGDYTPIDEMALPKNCPADTLNSAKIINFEISSETYRIEKFTEAIQLDDKNALAWFNRGRAYIEARNYREALKDFNEAISRDEGNPRFQNGRGTAYYCLSRFSEALREFEQIIRSFGDTFEHTLREEVANALFNKALTLSVLDRHDQALVVYDRLVNHFRDASQPAVRKTVANALFNRAVGLLPRQEQAIDLLDKLIKLFGDAPETTLQESVAQALFAKAAILGYDDEKEIAVYDELLKRFGNAPQPTLREEGAKARNSKGQRLCSLGRQKLLLGHFKEGCEYYRKAIECNEACKIEAKSLSGIMLFFDRAF